MVLLGAWAPAASLQAQPSSQAKYVFLMIGDGMGQGQRTAAEIYLAGPQEPGRPPRVKPLVMNTLPVAGMMRTYSADSLITDSAAAATAMATGQKAPNGVVCLDVSSGRMLATLAEIAAAQGRKIGIVSTAAIDDATPACFYAHVSRREKAYDISMQLSASGMDYFAGGRPDGIMPQEVQLRPSPLEAARKSGYTILTQRQELLALKKGAGKVLMYWPPLEDPTPANPAPGATSQPAQAEQEPPPPPPPSLAEMTRKGIELLDQPAGFFMMIEGGEIDGYCHQHDLHGAIRETLEFDKAVAEALEFYKKHPQETLIVVLADHETGGLGLGNTGRDALVNLYKVVSGQPEQSSAFNKKVLEFRKNKTTFEAALPAITEFFGLENVSGQQAKLLAAAYGESMKDPKDRLKDEAFKDLYGSFDPLTTACSNLVSRKAGVSWTTYSHTGVSVPVTAIGAGSERFAGYYENTEVFEKLLAAMSLSPRAK
jgi:alkaline phosphatase